jgi:DNA-binding transcriptional regulator YdaS (Cro superfamily)
MERTAHESPQDALRAAVAAVGSQSALARLVGVTQPAVSIWLRKGDALPPEHVIAVEAATGVSRHDLRPDIYPPSERSIASHESGPATDLTLEPER